MAEETSDGTPTANAFLKLKEAPSAMSPSGVAMPPTLETAFPRMAGMGSLSSAQAHPATMPRMIGLVAMPLSVRLSRPASSPSPSRRSGLMSCKITTADTL